MKVTRYFALVLVGFVGCSDSSDDGDGGAGGGSGSTTGAGAGAGGGGSVCYDVPVNTSDGGEACGQFSCPAGQYCEYLSGSICSMGCIGDATCPKDQYCDLSTGEVGTCRKPGAEHEIACTTSSSSTGPAKTCLEICEAKISLCAGGEGVPAGICDDVCTVATPMQQECLQEAMCASFADGEECGLSFGGIGE